MTKIKMFFFVCLCLTIGFVLFGAVPSIAKSDSKDSYRIGFSNGFTGNVWRQQMLLSLEQEKQKHPEIEELIVLDGQGKIDKQITDIESLIAQQVDAIITIPNSGTALCPVLRKARKLGIKVVPFNLEIACDDYDAYVGLDPAYKGKTWAEFLVKKLDGKGKIVAFGGIPGNQYSAIVWEAAEKVFKNSQIEVLAYKYANFTMDQAKIIMADLLNTYPKIDGIFSDGAEMATGAMKAIIDADRELVPITGLDGNGLLKMYMKYKGGANNLDICLVSEPTWQSKIALQVALDLCKGIPTKKRTIINPTVITSENAQEYVRPNLPDTFQLDTDLSEELIKKLFSR